jgi:hypothetical protein
MRVGSPAAVILPDVKGVPAGQRFDEYVLMYRTTPDHQIAAYAIGIGLTEFVYSHHGTPAEVRMKLTEFHTNASQ